MNQLRRNFSFQQSNLNHNSHEGSVYSSSTKKQSLTAVLAGLNEQTNSEVFNLLREYGQPDQSGDDVVFLPNQSIQLSFVYLSEVNLYECLYLVQDKNVVIFTLDYNEDNMSDQLSFISSFLEDNPKMLGKSPNQLVILALNNPHQDDDFDYEIKGILNTYPFIKLHMIEIDQPSSLDHTFILALENFAATIKKTPSITAQSDYNNDSQVQSINQSIFPFLFHTILTLKILLDFLIMTCFIFVNQLKKTQKIEKNDDKEKIDQLLASHHQPPQHESWRFLIQAPNTIPSQEDPFQIKNSKKSQPPQKKYQPSPQYDFKRPIQKRCSDAREALQQLRFSEEKEASNSLNLSSNRQFSPVKQSSVSKNIKSSRIISANKNQNPSVDSARKLEEILSRNAKKDHIGFENFQPPPSPLKKLVPSISSGSKQLFNSNSLIKLNIEVSNRIIQLDVSEHDTAFSLTEQLLNKCETSCTPKQITDITALIENVLATYLKNLQSHFEDCSSTQLQNMCSNNSNLLQELAVDQRFDEEITISLRYETARLVRRQRVNILDKKKTGKPIQRSVSPFLRQNSTKTIQKESFQDTRKLNNAAKLTLEFNDGSKSILIVDKNDPEKTLRPLISSNRISSKHNQEIHQILQQRQP